MAPTQMSRCCVQCRIPTRLSHDLRLSFTNTTLIYTHAGFYIKCGQMSAANIGDAFPKIWQETMSVLQDQVPHKDFETIKAIIEEDMGKPLGDVFATFEPDPIGSASIGQVHRATLHNGQS